MAYGVQLYGPVLQSVICPSADTMSHLCHAAMFQVKVMLIPHTLVQQAWLIETRDSAGV